jgi:hypothetical protein
VTAETGFNERDWIDSSGRFDMKILQMIDGEGPERHAMANRFNGIPLIGRFCSRKTLRHSMRIRFSIGVSKSNTELEVGYNEIA